VLAYFDVHTVTTDLYCDASGVSIGAVLQQTDKDGEVRPVGFYSRKLTPDEKRYSTYDRELVGCVTAVCIFGINSWVFLSRYTQTTADFDGFLVNQISRLSSSDGLLSLVNFR
jgi:hypothetical protein